MWKMTKWQRGVLLGMYTVSSRANKPSEVWFTRRALEWLMWFDWQGSHTAKMYELIDHKWTEMVRNESGVLMYRLTPAAYGSISADVSHAMSNIHLVEQQDKLL